MKSAVARSENSIAEAIESVLAEGDLSKLSSEECVIYYNKVCESLGLNPLTKPFEYMKFQGRKILYARKDCTDQLRRVYRVTVKILSTEIVDGIYIVRAQATMPDGRQDESIGALAVGNANGVDLANLYMKGETKAKRRVTLSICGLGMLDETEIETEQFVKNEAHAEKIQTMVAVPTIEPAASNAEYLVPFGKYTGKKLAEIERGELALYVTDLHERARKEKKQIQGTVKEFIERAERSLA